MSAIPFNQEMTSVLKPWDGSTWFVERPASFVPSLFTFSQLQARDILRRARGLTQWEAEVCQRAYYSHKLPRPGVQHWLDKIEGTKCREVCA